MVNPPLASTAVSVVPPQRAGMASGVNNTFRQVGIATGIAGLGAIFRTRSSRTCTVWAPAAVASGAVQAGGDIARAAFIAGLNEILLVGAIVAFAAQCSPCARPQSRPGRERAGRPGLARQTDAGARGSAA